MSIEKDTKRINTQFPTIKMSVSGKQNEVKSTGDFEYNEINSREGFALVIKNDHLFSEVENGVRNNQNFIQTELLWGDIDNTHSVIPDEWITVQQFQKDFKDYKFILYTSKSHQIPKGGSPARDKFHVIFPLDTPITDGVTVKNLHSKIYGKYKFFDTSCKDQTHFFIGTDDCGKEVIYNLEGVSITQYIEGNKTGESSDNVNPLTPSVMSNNNGSGWGQGGDEIIL